MPKPLAAVQSFYKATITVAASAGVTKIYVSTLPTPSAGYLVINSGNATKREVIYYSAKGTDGTGNYVDVTAIGDRGMCGTTAQTHEVQESVRANITSAHWDDMIAAISVYMPISYLDIDGTLAANSDVKIPSQKAVKTYIDLRLLRSGGTMTGALILSTSSPSTALEAASKGYVDVPTTARDMNGQKITSLQTPTNPSDASTKAYADGLTISGSPDATTTSKGISRISVAPVSTIIPISVGDNDPRVPTQPENDALQGTGTPSNSNRYVTADTLLAEKAIGDGSDGNVTISSPTTLTRDMYYVNLTVNSTLTTDGYKIFVKGTINGTGTIDWGTPQAGSAGGGGVSGSRGAGGAGGGATGSGQFISSAGALGAGGGSGGSTGNNGANATSCVGGGGVAGGGGYGSGGGSGGSASIQTKFGIYSNITLLGVDFKKDGTFVPYQSAGGAGGGGGGGDSNSGASAGGGGGGGASGGIVFIVANIWAGTFTIKSIGGAGGAGGAAYAGGPAGGGGGGGGRGGNSIFIYNTKTWTGSYVFTGGAGGAGGATSGTSGTSGTSYEINIVTLTR